MAAAWFLISALLAGALALPTEVTTEYGRIQGKDEVDPGVVVRISTISLRSARLFFFAHQKSGQAFYGIPFASPPVKDLRFKSPVVPNTWSNVRDCSHDSYFHVSSSVFVGLGLLFLVPC